MEQLLAHLLGDYVLQNHWMANTKTKSSLAALVHVLLYGIPFLFLTSAWWQWVIIVGTHYVIDRYRLAAYWVDFWGTGKEGSVLNWCMRKRGFIKVVRETMAGNTPVWEKVVTDETATLKTGTHIPVIPDAPAWLGVWLLILVDNTMHLCINFAVLKWL